MVWPAVEHQAIGPLCAPRKRLPIESIEQRRKPCCDQANDSVLHVGQQNEPFSKPLGEQAHAPTVPIDQLHQAGAFGAEHIHGTEEQTLAYQYSEPFGTFAEVDELVATITRTQRTDHVQFFRARITAAIVAASVPRPARTATPLNSSSMMPLLSTPAVLRMYRRRCS